MNKVKVEDMDLYELFGLSIEATIQEIKKAYRKKALACHPDKNPDNPKACELFLQLSEALKILTDDSARALYDKVLKAKKAAKLRHKELDIKRKKFKDDLEAREEAARLEKVKEKTDEEKLQAEIERLRKEGAKQLEEEMVFLSKQIYVISKTGPLKVEEDGSDYKIKISWNIENGDYDEETLHRMLSKYGDIVGLVLSGKNKGTALVEFERRDAAELAYQLEQGTISNPIHLGWVNENKRKKVASTTEQASDAVITERDYESLVMRKLRQAEERKRLIEQMQNEDSDSGKKMC